MIPAEEFRAAVEAADFAAAEAAAGRITGPLRNGSPALEDLARACAFLDAAVAAVSGRRTRLAGELARLRLMSDGYRGPRTVNTWRISG